MRLADTLDRSGSLLFCGTADAFGKSDELVAHCLVIDSRKRTANTQV
jgi:hypothetical protein